jgi:hypothetical protein
MLHSSAYKPFEFEQCSGDCDDNVDNSNNNNFVEKNPSSEADSRSARQDIFGLV